MSQAQCARICLQPGALSSRNRHLNANVKLSQSLIPGEIFPRHALRFDAAVALYGATFIRDALARFVVSYGDSSLTPAEIERRSRGIFFRFSAFPVFHKLKFVLEDAQHLGIMEDTRDTAHARPARSDHTDSFDSCWLLWAEMAM